MQLHNDNISYRFSNPPSSLPHFPSARRHYSLGTCLRCLLSEHSCTSCLHFSVFVYLLFIRRFRVMLVLIAIDVSALFCLWYQKFCSNSFRSSSKLKFISVQQVLGLDFRGIHCELFVLVLQHGGRGGQERSIVAAFSLQDGRQQAVSFFSAAIGRPGSC